MLLLPSLLTGVPSAVLCPNWGLQAREAGLSPEPKRRGGAGGRGRRRSAKATSPPALGSITIELGSPLGPTSPIELGTPQGPTSPAPQPKAELRGKRKRLIDSSDEDDGDDADAGNDADADADAPTLPYPAGTVISNEVMLAQADRRTYCSFCCKVDVPENLVCCCKCQNSGHLGCLTDYTERYSHSRL